MGTLLAAVFLQGGGYNLPLALVFLTQIAAVVYIIVFIKESYRPRDKEELHACCSLHPQGSLTKEEEAPVCTKVKDFFDWHRVFEVFTTAFKRRDGNGRAVLLLVVAANMVRRLARGNISLFTVLSLKP